MTLNFILLIVLFGVGILLAVLAIIHFSLVKNYKSLSEDQVLIKSLYEAAIDKYDKLLHQKKSSEVRLGKISEHLAPFLDEWPWDSNNFRFIGTPIDGIQFNEDEIVFVEIKTGKSKLSKYQKKCQDLVAQGKVRFSSFRISTDAIEVK